MADHPPAALVVYLPILLLLIPFWIGKRRERIRTNIELQHMLFSLTENRWPAVSREYRRGQDYFPLGSSYHVVWDEDLLLGWIFFFLNASNDIIWDPLSICDKSDLVGTDRNQERSAKRSKFLSFAVSFESPKHGLLNLAKPAKKAESIVNVNIAPRIPEICNMFNIWSNHGKVIVNLTKVCILLRYFH